MKLVTSGFSDPAWKRCRLGSVVEIDFDRKLRLCFDDGWQRRQHPTSPESDARRDAHPARRFMRRLRHGRHRLVEQTQRHPCIGEKALPLLGDRQPPGAARATR
jgi:hypothetical protein